MEIIKSPNNFIIKYIKSLRSKKQREKNEEFIVEGLRFSKEALKFVGKIVDNAYYEISRVIVSESFFVEQNGFGLGDDEYLYEKFIIEDKLFKDISDTENPQGIMITIKIKNVELSMVDVSYMKQLLLLDSLQDPGNMGTVIRTADAFGFDGILLTDGCVDIYNPKVLRATMGSVFHIPIFKLKKEYIKELEELKSGGYRFIVAHLKGESCSEEVLKREFERCVLVIGNEANGVSNEVSSLADWLIKISMQGEAESLNASVAAGILMYELSKKRQSNKL